MNEENKFLEEYNQKLQKAIEVLREDLATIRTGRANPEMIAHTRLSVYGGTAQLEINELGTLTTDDPQTLVLVPFDLSIISEIENSLRSAKLNLSIIPEENKIRLKLPPMSEERRKEYLILAGKKIEGSRIMVRQIRREAMQEIDKNLKSEQIGEDEKFRLEKLAQEIVDKIMEKIKEIGEKKEEEIRNI